MTTKIVIQTMVILGFGAAAYVSVSTSLKLNQAASSDLITSIDRNRQMQAELYKESSDESTRRILSLLDRTQENIKTAVDQNLALTKSIDDMSRQNKELSEQMAQVLGQHTKTLEQAKAKASQAAQAAQTNQIRTQRAIKEISKPKKSWWGGFFATPTPSLRSR